MSGTSAGAQKAKLTNLKKDPDFYSNIGQRSWKNPDRSRETGFALLTPEERAELGRVGGKKTKSDYKTTLSQETSKGSLTVKIEEEDPDTLISILKDSDSGSL
jgi:general stress protein YciG